MFKKMQSESQLDLELVLDEVADPNLELDLDLDFDLDLDLNIETEKLEVRKLSKRLHKLTCQQKETDSQLRWLKANKKELLQSFPEEIEQGQQYDNIPHFSYILPLVENIYWLELKEKAMKEFFKEQVMLAEGRKFGQDLLKDSISSEECILKRWYEELSLMKIQQKDLLSLAADKDDKASIHNVSYMTNLCKGVFVETLSYSVLCKTVSVGLKLKSSMPYCNKHHMSFTAASISVFSDIHIPDLKDKVTQMLEVKAPVSNVISIVRNYIASDIAPFVIGLPLKLKKIKQSMRQSDLNTFTKEDGDEQSQRTLEV